MSNSTSPTSPRLIEAAVSRVVISHLDATSTANLRAYRGGTDSQLQAGLVDALNHVIETADIWEEAELKEENVAGLLPPVPPPAKSDSDLDRVRRNRILLFAAFPHYIAPWVVTLTGANFRPDSVVYLNQEELTDDEKPQFVNSETLKFKLKWNNHEPGTASVVVLNPKHLDRPADDDGNSEAFNVDLP